MRPTLDSFAPHPALPEQLPAAYPTAVRAVRRANVAKATAQRQSTGSWFVVEYGSQALHHIGTVLGPTSSAKGTVLLSV